MGQFHRHDLVQLRELKLSIHARVEEADGLEGGMGPEEEAARKIREVKSRGITSSMRLGMGFCFLCVIVAFGVPVVSG